MGVRAVDGGYGDAVKFWQSSILYWHIPIYCIDYIWNGINWLFYSLKYKLFEGKLNCLMSKQLFSCWVILGTNKNARINQYLALQNLQVVFFSNKSKVYLFERTISLIIKNQILKPMIENKTIFRSKPDHNCLRLHYNHGRWSP